ncbi:MAG: acyl-CoA thioesterase [Desulfuromonadales bacterium]
MNYHETHIQVRFNEVDCYNVAWHGHYITWLEVGRNDLAGRFGLDAVQLRELGFVGPVVNLEMKFLRPARFKDEITVRTTLRPSESATLVFVSEIVGPDRRKLASAVTTHALTDENGVLQYKIPRQIAERLNRMTEWLRCV